MKKHNFFKYAAALCLSAICLLFLPTNANAEYVEDTANGVSYDNKIYISSYYAGEWANGGDGPANINLANAGDRVMNVKSKNKNLLAKKTYESFDTNISDTGSDTSYTQASISFFGKKKGTYKVTFDVVKADGSVRCTKTIKVYVDKYPAQETGIKKITYAGKEFLEHEPFATTTSGKLKVTLKKGYKLVSIYVKKQNKNGEWKGKRVRNGKKITLAKRSNYTTTDEWSTQNYNPLFPETLIEITIKNKKTKEAVTHVYVLHTMNKK